MDHKDALNYILANACPSTEEDENGYQEYGIETHCERFTIKAKALGQKYIAAPKCPDCDCEACEPDIETTNEHGLYGYHCLNKNCGLVFMPGFEFEIVSVRKVRHDEQGNEVKYDGK